MTVGEICNREVTIVERHEPVLLAAQLMREHHVGDVVVVEQEGDCVRPVGIVTDRDIVLELVAKSVDVKSVTVGDVMSSDLLTASEEDDIGFLLEQMQARGVRRVPVVDDKGSLAGIVTVDDLVDILAEQLAMLVNLVQRESKHEQASRVV